MKQLSNKERLRLKILRRIRRKNANTRQEVARIVRYMKSLPSPAEEDS